jgi:hypothetical protein
LRIYNGCPCDGLLSSIYDMLKFASANLGLIDIIINSTMKESHIIIKKLKFRNWNFPLTIILLTSAHV